jgi:hypothetical protein
MNGAGAAVDHEGKTTHSRSMPHDPFFIKQAAGHINVLARCIAQSGIGKMAIHPAQIESINEIFMPSKDSIAKAPVIAG